MVGTNSNAIYLLLIRSGLSKIRQFIVFYLSHVYKGSKTGSILIGGPYTGKEPMKDPTNAQNFTKLTYNYYFRVTWSEWRICMLR